MGACAALLLAAAALCGCSASTPEGTLEGFLSARVRGDDARAAELTVEGDLSGFLGGEPFLAGSDVSWEAGAAEFEEDRAVVTVRFAWSGGAADVPYVCRREGSKWKVALRETEEIWLSEPPGEGGGGGETNAEEAQPPGT